MNYFHETVTRVRSVSFLQLLTLHQRALVFIATSQDRLRKQEKEEQKHRKINFNVKN